MTIWYGFALLAAAVFPLGTIQVEGLKRLTPQQVIAASGLKVGQKVEKQDMDAAKDRLLASGALGSVGYRYAPSRDGNSYILTFEITEIDQVFPVRFEEIGRPEAELRKVLKDADPLFTDPVPATQIVIARYAAALNRHLKSDPPVVGRIFSDKPGEEALVFRPDRPRPTVATVTFKGNQAFPLSELQNRIASVAVGTLYTEERFRELLANQIKPLYETKGLLAVSFPKVTAVVANDVQGMNIEVELVEGPVYSLDKVTLTGAPNPKALLTVAAFKSNEPFNLSTVVDGLERMRAALRAQGYMKVSTETTRTYNHPRKTVDMQVAVHTGPQYKMGALKIEGLDITSEPEIRRIWGMKEGTPFRDGYPDRFLASVRDQGLFDNLGETKARLDYDEAGERINVTLQFAGEKKDPNKRKRPF